MVRVFYLNKTLKIHLSIKLKLYRLRKNTNIMKNFLLFSLTLWTINLYACDKTPDSTKKYIHHISIEAKPLDGKQCRSINILFKAKHTYPNHVESVFISMIQNHVAISEISTKVYEIIDGVNETHFCLNDQLIKESKITFILKQNAKINITSKGKIDYSVGNLCYTEVVFDIKDIVSMATIIENS